MATALERAVSPFDDVRRAALAVALRYRPTRALVTRRDARIGVHGVATIAFAAVLACAAPAATFVVGPLVLGVPHLAADIRYLLLRRHLSRRVVIANLAACVAFPILRLGEVTQVAAVPWAHIELLAAAAWIAAALAFGAARAGAPRRLGVGAGALVVAAGLALRAPDLARILFAHLHNLVGVVVWLWLFRRRRTAAIPVLAALVLATGFVLSGGAAALVRLYGRMSFAGQDLRDVQLWLAPGLDARLGLSVVIAYVFLQSVHYGVWLGWIPQEDIAGQGTTSFRMAARALYKDFGKPIVVIALVALLVAAAPLVLGAVSAREGYVWLASFHGYLELAMLGYLAMGAPRERAAV